MTPLSTKEEARLVSAVDEAIRLTQGGSSPNQAIMKVAQERQYGPEHINRMAQAYNKSKSVHALKTASAETRAAAFDLADPAKIVQELYAPEQKVASQFELPARDFSKEDMKTMSFNQKLASIQDTPRLDPETALRMEALMVRDLKFQKKAMEDHLHTQVQVLRRDRDNGLDKLAQELLPLTDDALSKIAQVVVNGYPSNGSTLMRIMRERTRRNIPEKQKTANAVVFPSSGPLLTVQQIQSAAQKMARAEIDLRVFRQEEKQAAAGSFVHNFLANVAADTLGDEDYGKKKDPATTDDLDPEFANKLKSHDVKRTFMSLALRDPDLQSYNYSDLVKAYNTTVLMIPEAYNNPAILKSNMLQHLQSSGIRDPFQMTQDLDIGKKLRERQGAQAPAGAKA
ncbi:MAG TPA: hypothetical protein VM537_19255 [Anaerolineae bacterium]|nr:hypothetical protein [Anaerolineae bacterium]